MLGSRPQRPTLFVWLHTTQVRNVQGDGAWVELTDITPYRGFIQRVVCPYHGINELVQASEGSPEHVKAGSRVPGLEVLWKGYQDEDETEE